MIDPKLQKACPVEDAIRLLKIPDDAAPWVLQSANFDPDFPRRYAFGMINVVPLQLATFLILRGVGYLIEDGPCDFLLEEDDEEDDEDDDVRNGRRGPQEDDGPAPRRTARRR